ncbi:alpha/beta fold hydrolase [Belnapia rosea]|uniref:alpha/beta fold hydrolase n=1 Tax=Belnapia rosea TaxID=938405 RepID=UPI000B85F638|nr:alpha/beta hydrolase [Belnapia rosea]
MRIDLAEGGLEAAWWGPGPEARPTILLLHEGLGSVPLWRDLPERLVAATGCGVMAYSRFGYGQSDGIALPRPLDYLLREGRSVLPRVLDAAGIRRCILFGHSDGGSIAIAHAGGAADPRVEGLVLLAPHVIVEAISLDGIRATLQRWEAGDLRARLARHHRDPEAAFLGWSGAWLDPAFPEVFDLRPEVARIRIPMLVIQGEADAYGTAEQVHAIARAATAPVETRLLTGTGHVPHQEAPETVLAAVREFAARIFEAGTPSP